MVSSVKPNSKIVLLLFLLLFPYIQQRTYSELPGGYSLLVSTFYRYTAILSSTFIYFICFRNRRKLKNVKFLYLFILYWSIYLTSTFLNDQSSFFYVFSHAYSDFALVLLVTLCCRNWSLEFFNALFFLYCGWIYLNFIFDLLFPSGLYYTGSYHTAHLLGDDNAMMYVMLPGIIIVLCRCFILRNTIRLIDLTPLFVSMISVLSVWAVSAFLSLFLFIILFVYIKKKKHINPFILLTGLIITIVICFVGLSHPLFSNIIENTLEKDITISGRTILWAQAVIDIIKKPILGYGGYFQYGSWVINVDDMIEYPCHTPYLQLLLDGGMLLFLSFLTIVIRSFLSVKKERNNIIGFFLAAGLISMMFNYITEYSQLLHFYIIVTMMFNVQHLKYLYLNDYNNKHTKR